MKILSLMIALGAFAAPYAHAKQNCSFDLDPKTVEIAWTAFKTTKKVAVPGTFTNKEIKGTLHASSLKKLLEGLQASLPDNAVDTKNPARDQTLHDAFFSKLAKAKISGKLRNVSEEKKKGELLLAFNGQQHPVPFQLEYNEATGQITATGTMDLLAFQAEGALKGINEACKALHAGPDGVSKTWSDVEIHLQAHISKSCK